VKAFSDGGMNNTQLRNNMGSQLEELQERNRGDKKR
jgi:hypothetical protein